jgi:uncharacterized short protein YbdD (DUF466 family)
MNNEEKIEEIRQNICEAKRANEEALEAMHLTLERIDALLKELEAHEAAAGRAEQAVAEVFTGSYAYYKFVDWVKENHPNTIIGDMEKFNKYWDNETEIEYDFGAFTAEIISELSLEDGFDWRIEVVV